VRKDKIASLSSGAARHAAKPKRGSFATFLRSWLSYLRDGLRSSPKFRRNEDYCNQVVRLDNTDFATCHFTTCTLSYSGKGPFSLYKCLIASDCQIELSGEAAMTAKALVYFYQLPAFLPFWCSLHGLDPKRFSEALPYLRPDGTSLPIVEMPTSRDTKAR
jgi:hypothetical protein